MNLKPFEIHPATQIKEDMKPYTMFPNLVLDILMPIVSGTEWKILSAVIRKTFGWHKEEDNISISQFMELTGLTNKTIVEKLKGLVSKGILLKKEDLISRNIDSLNPDFTMIVDDEVCKNYTRGSVKFTPGGSVEFTQGVVKNLHIQNKGLNKDLNKGLKDDLRPVTPYDVWEGIVGTISRHDFDKISRMIEDWKEHRTQLDSKSPDFQYWPDEIVIKAMRTMMNQPNPPDRPNLNYVEKIIQSWMKEGTEPKTKERVQKVRTATTTKAPEYDEDYRVELV